MDRGYDNNRVYDECRARGVAPVIPLRKGRIQPETPIKRGTPEWASLYKRRTAVEREFGRLKHEYGLAFLRVRGIERVRLHADLTMLGRLALALSRARSTEPSFAPVAGVASSQRRSPLALTADPALAPGRAERKPDGFRSRPRVVLVQAGRTRRLPEVWRAHRR